jgi:branched-chain amino acid transport system substrate-binding protein
MTLFTRRATLGGLAAAAVVTHATAQSGPVRIGWSVSRTGPNAGGANTTTLPNYQLWVRQVNEAGGLRMPGGARRMIEVVEYDDRSLTEEAVRNVDRLINQDRVDLVLPPWGTGLNLAVAPVLNRGGHPHLAVTANSERIPELVQRWPNAFFFLGRPSAGAEALISVLQGLQRSNGLGNTVVLLSVQDSFGIEQVTAARAALARNNFRILADRQYPLGSQDLAPLVAEASRANPEIFLAFSYPPDTLAITEQARITNFNPRVYYTAVGTAFPLFRQRFGANAEGVMGIGGVDPNNAAIRDYVARHTQVIGRGPDSWASPVTYASLQVLEQAIAQVGVDRPALIRTIRDGTFDTLFGPLKLENNQRVAQPWVGQWQGENFAAVGGAGPLQPVQFPKPAWRTA